MCRLPLGRLNVQAAIFAAKAEYSHLAEEEQDWTMGSFIRRCSVSVNEGKDKEFCDVLLNAVRLVNTCCSESVLVSTLPQPLISSAIPRPPLSSLLSFCLTHSLLPPPPSRFFASFSNTCGRSWTLESRRAKVRRSANRHTLTYTSAWAGNKTKMTVRGRLTGIKIRLDYGMYTWVHMGGSPPMRARSLSVSPHLRRTGAAT